MNTKIKRGESMGKKVIVGIIVCVLALSGIIGTIIAVEINNKHISDIVERDVIYEGIYVEKIHIGGLSKEDAIKYVQAEVKRYEDQKQLKILAQGKELHLLPYSYFENKFDYRSVIDKAYQVARNGDNKTRYKLIKKLETEPIVFTIEDHFEEQKFVDLMNTLKQAFDVEPQDACLERKDSVFVIRDEVIGKTIVLDKSIVNIKEALNNELDSVELEVVEIKPAVTKEVYKDVNALIGSYFTSFSSYQASRNENLSVASAFINGTILMPGEIFSTNETIGPVDAVNGYKDAPIILNGKIQPGIAIW
jgi:vancomycin resistance protein YoaR